MESAAERKARLKALRAAAEESGEAAPRGDPNDEPQVKFRNYVPKDDELRTAKLAPAAAPASILDASQQEEAPLQPEADDGKDVVQAVQPKKANWDLQRDVAKKLEKLERRTQRAMVELCAMEEAARMRESGLA